MHNKASHGGVKETKRSVHFISPALDMTMTQGRAGNIPLRVLEFNESHQNLIGCSKFSHNSTHTYMHTNHENGACIANVAPFYIAVGYL